MQNIGTVAGVSEMIGYTTLFYFLLFEETFKISCHLHIQYEVLK